MIQLDKIWITAVNQEHLLFTDNSGNPIWQDTYEYGLHKEKWKNQ